MRLVWVRVDPDVAADRRAARDWHPAPAWLKGRQSKVANLVADWPGEVITVDGSGEAAVTAAELVAVL